MSALLLLVLAQASADVPSAPEAGAEDAGVVLAASADGGVIEDADSTDSPQPVPWWEGDHMTGEWGGFREWLDNHGVTIDFVYAGEVFADASQPNPGPNGGYNGHFDLAVTLDFEEMGLWPGGKFYVLGQNNHGDGINEYVGSVTEISNIESKPYFQIGEFFYEQALFGWLKFRLGKQDSNRDFGTPRFGGNFINNNFGMLPSSPLPSYPTNGLGAVVIVQPVWWGNIKAAIFEGSPKISSFGFDSAFAPNAGHFLIAAINGIHHWGKEDRNGGTTTFGAFRQSGQIREIMPDPEDPSARIFNENYGVFAQNDERIYLDDDHPLNIISRFGWSQPDRNLMSLFFSTSIAVHGFGPRKDDTIGIGFGYFTVNRQANGTPGQGGEFFMEVFYKWRMSKFMSLQPDLQYYRTPGGDGADALLVGVRVKFKM